MKMRNSQKAQTIPENKNRRINKLARGFGMGAVEKFAGTDEGNVVKWNQSRDPLFGVKGKERTAKMKNLR